MDRKKRLNDQRKKVRKKHHDPEGEMKKRKLIN